MLSLTSSAQRKYARGASPILVSAALSIAALISVAGMRAGTFLQSPTVAIPEERELVQPRSYLAIDDADGNGMPDWQDELARAGISFEEGTTTATSSDPLISFGESVASALYGGYLSLKQAGNYSPTQGDQLAQNIASQMRAPEVFVPHSVEELHLDERTSSERALAYRSDMREATAPLITNDPPELDLFAKYLLSKDPMWLAQLSSAALRYRETETNMLALSVPRDAAPEHLRALNSLGAYATTLERLSQFGTDALMSVALVKSLNEGEKEMLYAFDSLAKYYVRTIN
jgi:hypothetical protein